MFKTQNEATRLRLGSSTSAAVVVYAQCERCKAYVQSPRMDDASIAAYYGTGLYRQWLGRSQEELDGDEYIRASDDAALIRKLIDYAPARHLDIGSSRGHLLNLVGAALQVGVEPNVEYNQNEYAAIHPTIQDVKPITFDLVTMIHSLEHETNPMSLLRRVDELAERWIVIEVPSEQSRGGWARLAHTFHFPVETLEFIAQSLSWKIRLVHHTPHRFVLLEK